MGCQCVLECTNFVNHMTIQGYQVSRGEIFLNFTL